MARKLILLVGLCLGVVWARPGPVEIQLRPPRDPACCEGCDCARFDCFTPCCDCTLAPTDPWCEVMLERLRQRLVASLGARMQVSEKLVVRLVDPARLLQHGGDGVQGVYADGVITLSRTLTRREAVATLAHEYGHAWQAANHPGYDEVDGTLREGFAEWVALQALRQFGEGSGGDVLRRNRDPVYGGGLRWFLQVEKHFGREVVFTQATTWLDVRGRRLTITPAVKKEEVHDPSVPDHSPDPGESP